MLCMKFINAYQKACYSQTRFVTDKKWNSYDLEDFLLQHTPDDWTLLVSNSELMRLQTYSKRVTDVLN